MDNLAHLLKSSICLAYRNGKHSLIEVPGSAVSCFRTLNNKNTQYVVVCDHIGDFLITLGYLKAFKERYHYDHITLCIAENLVEILDLYPKVWDTLLILKKRKLYQLLSLGSTNFGIHILNKLKNITLVNPADAFVEEDFTNIIRYPNISFQDCIRFGCLKLQEKDLFPPPEIINRKYDTHNKKNIKKVIICPDARFIQFEKNSLFSKLAKELVKAGYEVFTNTTEKKEEPIEGTKAIYISLKQFFDFMNHGGIVIGKRSGILDLAAYGRGTVVAVYPDQEYFSLFDLQALPSIRANILQVFESDGNDKVINTIKLFLGGESCQSTIL